MLDSKNYIFTRITKSLSIHDYRDPRLDKTLNIFAYLNLAIISSCLMLFSRITMCSYLKKLVSNGFSAKAV